MNENLSETLDASREYVCLGPDEGDAESGPPSSVEPCCPTHFPHLSHLFDSDVEDDLPF